MFKPYNKKGLSTVSGFNCLFEVVLVIKEVCVLFVVLLMIQVSAVFPVSFLT